MNKDYITTIQELLKGRNEEFDNADKKHIKLVRHKDDRFPLYDLYLNDRDAFLKYQSEQLVKNFNNVEYFVSFIGEENTTSRFISVYKNNGIIKETGDFNGEKQAIYNFERLEGFELLEEKIIIDWKGSTRNWHQYYNKEMPVIRIDRGLMENNIPVFKRFEDVLLDYNQLSLIFQTGNAEWKSKLESCNCIYLILDKHTGKQYVGSTYGSKGIWGRWNDYAETGHGNDVTLKDLINDDPNYAKMNFQWCILETLPLNIIDKQAIERESLYKRKFGTLEHGYNNN